MEHPDHTGENIERGGRRIGAVEAGNKFVAHCELTDEDKEFVESLGLTVPPAPPLAEGSSAAPEVAVEDDTL